MMKKILVYSVIMVLFTPGIFAQYKNLNLSPCEFRPSSISCSGEMYEQYLKHTAGTFCNGYYAPIHLPANAVIRNVMICYKDNSTSNLSVQMWRKKCEDDSAAAQMFYWESSGNTAVYRTYTVKGSDIAFKRIYSGPHSYCIQIHFEDTAGLEIYGVRIIYE